MRHGLKAGDGQRHWLGHAFDGELAFDAFWLVAFKDHLGRFECSLWKLGRVQEVFALDVFVEISKPVLTDFMSMTMSTEPFLASASNTTLPVVLLKLLSCVE